MLHAQGGDSWAGSEYKVRLLAGLAVKLQAKLGLLALKHNWLLAQHCHRLLQQTEDRCSTICAPVQSGPEHTGSLSCTQHLLV